MESVPAGKGEEISGESLLQDFIEDCALRGMAKATVRSYRSNVGKFLRFLERENGSIHDLDQEHLKGLFALLRKRRFSANTILNYFSSISSFYDFLISEGLVPTNPVVPFRRRYLRRVSREREKSRANSPRKLLSAREMSILANSILSVRDRAIVVLLAKTGNRRGELVRIDVDDIDWDEMSIRLKEHPKGSNTTVFFDSETARSLHRWLRVRSNYATKDTKALFVGVLGNRLGRNGIYRLVVKHATTVRLHNPQSTRTQDHVTPHCFRHWFTTHLLRNGMPREYVKELRGDMRREAIDLYHHIDGEDLRREYLAAIPVLGL
ncbi:MAG: tyrosine-type recombinase/integrase [Thermoplasmata archaeon]|nr:tyrosine-type recombinase/integrase [Thermoplasmata archaeon]